MATTYGTGTALQFSDATQRQVLELGSKIHYYNPDVTPILSIFGMKSAVTPVPIFEWMEDEFMLKRTIKQDVYDTGADSATTAISDTAYETTQGANNGATILNFDRQAQMEGLEAGAVYSVTFTETSGTTATLPTANTHVLCVAVGVNVDCGTASHKAAQFVGCHTGTVGSDSVWYIEANADGVDLFTGDSDAWINLTYVNNAGAFYDAGTATAYYGHNISPTGANSGFGLHNLADADYFIQEGGVSGIAEGAAVGVETRKKVRRLKNCTQIFREPYTITGTADAAKHYGGSELARLQARKLAKIKVDCEYAMMTNGNVSLDATSENPKRTFAGFGVGGTALTGFVQTNDGRGNSNLQLTYSSGTMSDMDGVCEYIFHDMIDGSMRKTVFASNKWLRKLASMIRLGTGSGTGTTAFYDLGDSSQAAGVRVRRFVGAVGELDFIPHPLMNGVLEDYALVIDPANFAVRPLAGRDMQLRKDIVKDGRDGQTDEWMIEFGPEARNEQTHAILKLSA